MDLYDIDYKFFDELQDKSQTWRRSYVMVYNSRNGLGKKFDKSLYDIDLANKLLREHFDGLNDDNIAFYYDRKLMDNENDMAELVVRLQQTFDIIVNDLSFVKGEQ